MDNLPLVGLLCSEGDQFGQTRSEMLAGPMALAGVTPVRFLCNDIDSRENAVVGKRHVGGQWIPGFPAALTAVIDLTRPCAQRTTAELRLLDHTPHSTRVDLDRYELLRALLGDTELASHIVPSRPFDTYGDLVVALAEWRTVFVKRRAPEGNGGSVCILPHDSGWKIADSESERHVDEARLRQVVEPMCGTHFIQAYVPATTPCGRPFALISTTQQRGDLAWMVPTVHCIVGNFSVFASLDAGGEYIGSPFVVPPPIKVFDTTGKLPPGLSVRIQAFTVLVARRIAETVGGNPGALAMRILVDSSFVPRIVDIDTRPPAPYRAARNLEFHRHWTTFALGLATRPEPTTKLTTATRLPTQATMPEHGVSIRSQVAEADAIALAGSSPPWLDVSLAFGGRCLLSRIAAAVETTGRPAPYLSLRLGVAANDAGCTELGMSRFLATEEYLGRGLLNWAEAKSMRSVRRPLLAAQFTLARQLLRGAKIGLVSIDDFDLGIRALPVSDRIGHLQSTVSWLDEIADDDNCANWGIGLATVSTESLTWLDKLIALSEHHRRPSHVFIRVSIANTDFLAQLVGRNVLPVLLAANNEELATAREYGSSFPVLTTWNTVRDAR